MPQNNTIDDAVKNADAWELAQNPVYRNLQQKLIERTFERDLFLNAYAEVVQAAGPDVFEEAPDRFHLKDLVAKVEDARGKIKEALLSVIKT